MLIVSYSISKQEARLYSKYMAEIEPNTYDLRLWDAATATSAAPAYWEVLPTTL